MNGSSFLGFVDIVLEISHESHILDKDNGILINATPRNTKDNYFSETGSIWNPFNNYFTGNLNNYFFSKSVDLTEKKNKKLQFLSIPLIYTFSPQSSLTTIIDGIWQRRIQMNNMSFHGMLWHWAEKIFASIMDTRKDKLAEHSANSWNKIFQQLDALSKVERQSLSKIINKYKTLKNILDSKKDVFFSEFAIQANLIHSIENANMKNRMIANNVKLKKSFVKTTKMDIHNANNLVSKKKLCKEYWKMEFRVGYKYSDKQL